MHKFDSKIFKLKIWDTGGVEKFGTISSSYYRGAHGCFLVYDITDRNSFLNLDDLLPNIIKHSPNYNTIILIGNKSDLLHMREVTFEEAVEFAKNNDMIYIESSALRGYGREEIINIMISSIENQLLNKNFWHESFNSKFNKEYII